MIVMVKVGVELVFEIMVVFGIIEEFVYYELLYELLFIVNIIVCKCLYEMNVVIFDIVEYGNYLFFYVCVLLLKEFMIILQIGDLGIVIVEGVVDNVQLCDVNEVICSYVIEQVGKKLCGYMIDMKCIVVVG